MDEYTPANFRKACIAYRSNHGTGPLLYVVADGGNQPDDVALKIIRLFEDSGFEIQNHVGSLSISEVFDKATTNKANLILLCHEGTYEIEKWKLFMQQIRSEQSKIFELLVCGKEPQDTREGDWGVPFLFDTDRGEEWMLRLIGFILSSLGIDFQTQKK